MTRLWILPQAIGITLIPVALYAHLVGEWLHGLAFAALALLSLWVSWQMFSERG